MYIVSVIPLVKIPYPNPQLLSYFCAKKIPIGALVKIPVRNKKINAIVTEQKSVEEQKFQIKKLADYTVKPIDKIVSEKPILTEKQLKLLFWFSDYYFAPLGMTAKIFISATNRIKKSNFQFSISNFQLTSENKFLVFAPFKNLKSITIKDESSDLYKSWGRKPYYNAKDIAVELAKIHKAKLTLESEFPSIETFYGSQEKKFALKISAKGGSAFGGKNSSIVDMREEIRNGNTSIISKNLQEKLKNPIKAILYIARKGTSTFVMCRECGYVAMCKNCEVPMVFHEDKPSRRLICHHCGKDDIAPVLCPICKSAKIKYFGAGTQKVETEIKKLFPDKKVFRLDSDISEKPQEQVKIIKDFINAENSVLIGTQMILNKNLEADLSAIISIETILNLPDFENTERVFRIINQLRSLAEKNFLIQTYNPDNFTLKSALANNFEKFYNEEIKTRKAFNYPPFSQIIKLSYCHKDSNKARNEAKILAEKLKQQKKYLKLGDDIVIILGPNPAFVAKENGKYKWNIVLKSKIEDLKLRNRLLMIANPYWDVEVDPESIL